jgi:hypothetical protein
MCLQLFCFSCRLAISFQSFTDASSAAVARSSSGKAADVGLPIPEKASQSFLETGERTNAYFADFTGTRFDPLSKIADLKSPRITRITKARRQIARIAGILASPTSPKAACRRVATPCANVQLIKAANDSRGAIF